MADERPLSSEEMIRRARRGLSDPVPSGPLPPEPVKSPRPQQATPTRPRPAATARPSRHGYSAPKSSSAPAVARYIALAAAVVIGVMGFVLALLFGSGTG